MDSCLRRNDDARSKETKPKTRHVLRHVQRSYNVKIVTNYNFSNPDCAGQISYNPLAIRIRTGLYQSILRHEISHHFAYKMLGDKHFVTNNVQGRAMNESFAHYFSCSTVSTNQTSSMVLYTHYTGYTPVSLQNVMPISTWFPSEPINEDIYSRYYCGFNLASAWWGLRSKSLFPPDAQGRNGVDTLLVESLKKVGREIPENDAYRYKPRYFYNILMSRVAANNISWPLNDKQVAIDSVYSVRGFHFLPSVQSVTMDPHQNYAIVTSETYNVLDEVLVHISNCPQNTNVKIMVVPCSFK